MFVKGVLIFGLKRKERLTKNIKAGYLAPYDTFKNRVGNLKFIQDIPMEPSAQSYPVMLNIENNLKQFSEFPIMIIWGRKDFCFNMLFLDKWREFFPLAEVHEVDDAGHLVVEDACDKVVCSQCRKPHLLDSKNLQRLSPYQIAKRICLRK